MLKEATISYDDYTDCTLETKEQISEKMEEYEFKLIKAHQKLEKVDSSEEMKTAWLNAMKITFEYLSLGEFAKTKGF